MNRGRRDVAFSDALLEELGRDDAAIASLERAARAARNAHEARQIDERIERIRERRRS